MGAATGLPGLDNMDASGHALAPATAAASAAPSPASPPVTSVAMTPAGGQLANLGAASLALGGTTAALGMVPASSLGSLAPALPALPALPEVAALATVAPALVLPLTLSGDTMANPNVPVRVPVQGQPNLSAWASPSQVTIYQTSPALFGLLSTVQGTATLQYAPGGSPNSASLVDGQGNVQGTLQGGQITLTNPAALTFTPPGTPASVAPATSASTGTPSASSLAGVPVRLGDTAAMTVPDAGAIPANPGFTPAPPMAPLPGYSPPNLNLPPLTGIPIPDQPAAPISTGSPLPNVNPGNWQESFPALEPSGPTILASQASGSLSGSSSADSESVISKPQYGPLDALGRPTGVTASITSDMIGTGTKANPNIIPPGWSGNGVLSNEARGHLLGAQLGGSGDVAENLVTLQQNPANSPVMRGFESLVRSAVESGQVVEYSSTPIYDGASLIPRGITLSGSGSGEFNLNVTVVNPSGAVK